MSLADLTAQFQLARIDSPTQHCIDRAELATDLHAALVPATTWPQLALTGLVAAALRNFEPLAPPSVQLRCGQ